MKSRATRRYNTAANLYAVYWLRIARSVVLIGQKIQLTGCDYDNDMRNAISVEGNVLT